MDSSSKLKIHAVAGIVTNAEGKFLIAQRPLNKPLGGLWEFPGGKIEKAEVPFAALQRELDEEIGIQVTEAKYFMTVSKDYNDKEILLDAWQVLEFSGQPFGKEQQPILWVYPSQLSQYQFPEANQPIIKALTSAM